MSLIKQSSRNEQKMTTHPYRGLPPAQFWNTGVSDVAPGRLDPVTTPRFTIENDDTVSTLGSCFAQHLAREIKKAGFHYLETEPEETDTFSANYGNVYTVEQANQLLEKSFAPHPSELEVWSRDGRFYDSLRPNVFEQGLSSKEEVLAKRAQHHLAVQRVFTESDVIVFTLGLTEAWRSRVTGDVFPLAPGVSAGLFNPEIHEFKNYDVTETSEQLIEWCKRVHDLNQNVKILLTVSPVPLNATFEDRHVWTSTTYSKAVLRLAAQAAFDKFDFVDYFPSYEIITSPHSRGRYFADDLREVLPLGVQHVMRVFSHHYLGNDSSQLSSQVHSYQSAQEDRQSISDVFCDESLIQQ